jgi:hypothetical protein
VVAATACGVEEPLDRLADRAPGRTRRSSTLQPRCRTQLVGVLDRAAERRGAAVGHQLGEVRLEAVGHLVDLLGVEVGELVTDAGQEEPDLRRDGAGLGCAHALTPCKLCLSRIVVTVVEKAVQSSRCCLSWARPAGVIP